MSDVKNPIATVFGTYYPRHYIVAVIHDPSAAAKARDALAADGFADANVELCPGADFVRNWNDYLAHRGIAARLADLFPADEHEAITEYLEEANNGSSFVMVHTPEHQGRDRARDILREYGAHDMRYYGDNTIVDLDAG
jgi:hypothetical protein